MIFYQKTFLNNWLLANFGMLQRAPETSQREILNYLSSFDMLNYMGNIARIIMTFYQDISDFHEFHLILILVKFMKIWYVLIKCHYNSSYHVKVLQVTAMARLHCQLQFNQILNMPSMVSPWCLCKNTATSGFMEKTFLRLSDKQILFVIW